MSKRIPVATTDDHAARLAAGRECGPCYACCFLPRVRDENLSKTAFTDCPHLKKDQAGPGAGGCCGIYETRPEVCRTFVCMWREGLLDGDERRRPDQLGLYFNLAEYAKGQPAVMAWELWEGAARDHPGRWVLDFLKRKLPVMIYFYGVPASYHYKGPETFLTGAELSAAARERPEEVGQAVLAQLQSGTLLLPDDPTYSDDGGLGNYLAGIPVDPSPFSPT